MLLNFSQKTDKEQIHIIDGKIVKNYFLHPLNASKDKQKIFELFSESFKDYNITPINETNKIFMVEKNGLKRYYSIDVTDFGGRTDGGVKVEIPFSNVNYSKLLSEGELVSVINLYVPLKTVSGGFEIDKENIVYIFLNPLQIYIASGYPKILNGEKKITSSNRWTCMKDILQVINTGVSMNTKPKKARKAMVASQYIKLVSHNDISNSFIDNFEASIIKNQIEEWKQMANEFNSMIMSDNKIKQQLQAFFRRSLISKDGMVCSVQNCDVQRSDLLIASHIKPKAHIWNANASDESKVKEITDPNNGIMLCRKHDSIFDRGYVTFNSDGSIKSTKNIELETFKDLFTDSDKISTKMIHSKEEYLNYHRNHIFK